MHGGLHRVDEHGPPGAGQRELARAGGLVVQRDPANLDVVGRRHGDLDVDGDALLAEMQLGLVHRVRRAALRRRRQAHAPRRLVAQIEPDAIAVLGRVRLVARQRQPAPPQPAAARAGDQAGEATVAQHERLRTRMRRRQPRRRGARGLDRVLVAVDDLRVFLDGPLGGGHVGRALVEERLAGLDLGIGVKAIDHRACVQHVAERDEEHPLVVRHVGPHDRHRGMTRPVRPRARRRQIERLEQAVRAQHPHRFERDQVGDDRARSDRDREERRVGADDPILLEPALEAEAGDPEGSILIGLLAVDPRVRRLGDAPRCAGPLGVGDLRVHDRRVGSSEQRAVLALHQEAWHEVLEHRAAPRQQGRGAVQPRQRATQRVPVRGGDVALDDRDIAREPRLRRQEVVVVQVELVAGGVVADVKELPFAVVEELEVHLADLVVGAHGERLELSDQRLGVHRAARERRVEALRRQREVRRARPEAAPGRRLRRELGAQACGRRGDLLEAERGGQREADRGGVGAEREPGQQRVELTAHLAEVLMEAIDRRAQGVQQIGLVAVDPGLEEREQLAIELGRGVAAEGPERAVRVVEVVARSVGGALHARDDLPERVGRCARRGPHGFLEQIDRVAEPIPVLRAHDGRGHQVTAAMLQRQETAGEVAAVDRRHVARQQRLEVLRVVPVEEVSLVVRHARDAVEGPPHAQRQLARADVPEVVGGERRDQGQADVGRGRPVGGLLVGLLLVVVDGEPLIVWPDELVEEAPGAACQEAQLLALWIGDLLGSYPHRSAHPPRHLGGQEPEGEQRRRHDERGRRAPREERRGPEREQRGRRQRRPEHRARRSRGEAERRVRGADPLQQVLARDGLPNAHAHDRVDDQDGLVREEHDREPAARQGLGPPPPGGDEPQRRGREHERERRERPEDGAAREPEPAEHEQREREGRDQAAPQVVGDLPAIDERELVPESLPALRGDLGQEPGQQLPVTAQPAVHAHGIRGVVLRIAFEEHDVGGQRRATVDPLEEVVADERVLRDATFDAAHERVHVVDAFADVDPGTEEVLIDLGAGVGVDVEADVPGEDAREQRLAGARRRGLDARLDDRVARDDATRGGVEDRAIQRMGEESHQPTRTAHRQLGIAVERDDEADAQEAFGFSDMAAVARLIIAAEQSIELLELAALALPADEALLAVAPAGVAVQEMKWADAALRVSGVEHGNAPRGALEQRAVVRLRRQRLGVHVVREQRELQLRIWIRQIVELDLPQHGRHILGAPQQRRDDDQRPSVAGQAQLEVQLRQRARRQQVCERRVHHGDRHGGRRHHGDEHGRDDRGEARAGLGLREVPADREHR